jgi:hypothetical protein
MLGKTMDGVAGALFWSSFPAMLFTAAAMAAGVLAVYFYSPSWRLRRIPGPRAYGLLGHLPLFDKHGSQVFGVLAKQYGSIYRLLVSFPYV